MFELRPPARLEHILASAYGLNYARVSVAMFTLYIDDSGTSPSNPVAIAAAWIAPVKAWLRLETEWRRVGDKEGFGHFHAAEFAARNPKSDFANWTEEKQWRVIRRLREITKKYVHHGVAFAIPKK